MTKKILFKERLNLVIEKVTEHNEEKQLNDVLDHLKSALLSHNEREVHHEGLLASVEQLTLMNEEEKERAYQLADERPIITNPEEYFKSVNIHEMQDDLEEQEIEEAREKEAMAFLDSLM